MQIILASASPRRKELMQQIGAEFQIYPSDAEEVITKSEPQEIVVELARQKAESIKNKYETGGLSVSEGKISSEQNSGKEELPLLVIGADTVVAADAAILGKPEDREDAKRMLDLLAGHTHQVYTGVSIWIRSLAGWQEHYFYEKTDVTMYPMSEEEKENYLNTPEPYDKAGAYGIQGKCAAYIEKICGDYNNVVGLPVARLYQEMKKFGIDICTLGK